MQLTKLFMFSQDYTRAFNNTFFPTVEENAAGTTEKIKLVLTGEWFFEPLLDWRIFSGERSDCNNTITTAVKTVGKL